MADVWNNGHPAGQRPSDFSGPLLLLLGSEDASLNSAIVARFPSARISVSVIDNAGHWPHIEQPSSVATAIGGFLDELFSLDTR